MYSIIDIESNGAGFGEEIIIDIAIFRYDGHQVIDQLMSLVNPQAGITPFVQKLTKITPKMVKTAPKFHEIAKRIIEITKGTTLVGHNVDFDYRMLRQSFRRLGYDFKIETLDTLPLAKRLIPEAESYSLGKLVHSLGIPVLDRHRAGGDARATLELFKVLLSKDTDAEIIQHHFEQTNAKTYANKIKELTQDLPHEQGIVYFQNADGAILHTDFVQDINKIAKKVFNSPSSRWAKVQTQCEQIHYQLAGNAMIAKLMMRSQDIKKREVFTYGLYYKNDKLFIEKTALCKDKTPILKFISYTQARKVLGFIERNEAFSEIDKLQKYISLDDKDGVWTSKGRQKGERCFIIVQNKRITGYGFYEFHSQIDKFDKIEKIKIPIKVRSSHLENEFRLSLLKNDFVKVL